MFIDLAIRAGLWVVTCMAIAMVAGAIAALCPHRHWLAIYMPAGALCWIALLLIP